MAAQGGIWRNGNVSLEIVSSTVDNNIASGRGGGLEVLGAGSFVLKESSVSGNRANGASFTIAGGGAVLMDVAPLPNETNRLEIRGSRIADNSAVFDGGGLNLLDTSRLEISDSEIVGNTAERIGGGVYAVDSEIVVTNSIISENAATGGSGGGIYGGLSVAFEFDPNARARQFVVSRRRCGCRGERRGRHSDCIDAPSTRQHGAGKYCRERWWRYQFGRWVQFSRRLDESPTTRRVIGVAAFRA